MSEVPPHERPRRLVQRRPLFPDAEPPGKGELVARRIAFALLLLLVLVCAAYVALAIRASIRPTRVEARANARAWGRSEARRQAAAEGGSLVGALGELFSWSESAATVYEVSLVIEVPSPRRLRVRRLEARSGNDRDFRVLRSWVMEDVAILPKEEALDVARRRLGDRFRTLDAFDRDGG